jgi:hypothetical protein
MKKEGKMGTQLSNQPIAPSAVPKGQSLMISAFKDG